MARFEYEEVTEYVLTNPQVADLERFIRGVWDGRAQDVSAVTVRKEVDGVHVAVIRGMKKADSDTIARKSREGKVTRISREVPDNEP